MIEKIGGLHYIFFRRFGFNRESPYSSASFSNGNGQNVAIENPGYMTADLQAANDMDEPYINTEMRESPYSGYAM